MATVGWQFYDSGGFYKASVDGMAAATSGLSTIISLKGYLLTNIIIPDAWTTAALTFLLSVDESTYNSVFTYDGELSYSSSNVLAGHSLGVKPEHAMQLQGLIKLRSGTKAAAVNQAASRTITLIAWKLENR
jgi:hypothetical protein